MSTKVLRHVTVPLCVKYAVCIDTENVNIEYLHTRSVKKNHINSVTQGPKKRISNIDRWLLLVFFFLQSFKPAYSNLIYLFLIPSYIIG